MLRLHHGRRLVQPFLDRVYRKHGIQQLIWVSPWITHVTFKTGDTNRLLNRLAARNALFTIITREPGGWSEDEHATFLEDVSRLENAEIIFVPHLHAKYYLCHATDSSFGLIGSPNMYRWTANSYEVAIALDSRGDGDVVIRELESVTLSLRTVDGRVLYKRRGKKP